MGFMHVCRVAELKGLLPLLSEDALFSPLNVALLEVPAATLRTATDRQRRRKVRSTSTAYDSVTLTRRSISRGKLTKVQYYRRAQRTGTSLLVLTKYRHIQYHSPKHLTAQISRLTEASCVGQ
jgi:hypothetical protein